MESQVFTPHFLDQIFPYFIFVYGATMTFVLSSSKLMQLAEERFPSHLLKQMQGHRVLALTCLCLGFVWSLQHLWFYSA